MSRTMSKKHLLVGFAAAGVLGVGIAAPTVAFAPRHGATPDAERQQRGSEQGTDRQQQRADRQHEFAEALATELGVDTDKVTAALEKVPRSTRARQGDRPERPSAEDRQEKLAERLTQAVKDGKLTQEQADAITKAVEAGVFPGPGPGGPGRHGGPAGTPDK